MDGIMKKVQWVIAMILFLSAVFVPAGYVVASAEAQTFSVPNKPEPKLSEDGLSLSNAQTIGVVVVDPNPAQPAVHIPAPQRLTEPSTASSTFQMSYLGAGQTDLWGEACYAVPEDTKAAFNQAGIIWGNLLQSAVPIKIQICWASLSNSRTLGYSGGGNYYRDFMNVPRSGTWYVSSLANSLAGTDINSGNYDMHITFNKNFSWYMGTDANPPSNQYDLETVALHEICHGLNFMGTMGYASGFGKWGDSGYPDIYDTFMRDESGNSIIDTTIYPNPSTALGKVVTSGNLWFYGPKAMAENGGNPVKIYAPTTWSEGSSYSHLDYAAFTSGGDRLMRYAIPNGTAIHEPGPVTMGLLKDLGWKTGSAATCQPKIRANGQTGSISVSVGTPVSIQAGLDPGDQSGKYADWWLIYSAPSGVYSLTSYGWIPGIYPLMTYPLTDVPLVEIYNAYLTAGDYAFYFGVDMTPNGILDLPLFYDSVQVYMDDPSSRPQPGTWNGSIVSFNVASDSKTLTSAGSSLVVPNYGYASLQLVVDGNACNEVTIYLANTISITGNSFSSNYTFSDGATYSLTGHFDSSTSASGTYSYFGTGKECSGSGIWTTNK